MFLTTKRAMFSKWTMSLLLVAVVAMMSGLVGTQKLDALSIAKDKGDSFTFVQDIKVLYVNQEAPQYPNKKYREFLNGKFPQAQVNVIEVTNRSNSKNELDQWIEIYQPDIVIVNQELVAQDNLYLKKYMPIDMTPLKGQVTGSTYTLSPIYSTDVFYCNVDLLEQHEVTFPQNKMNVNQLLNQFVAELFRL